MFQDQKAGLRGLACCVLQDFLEFKAYQHHNLGALLDRIVQLLLAAGAGRHAFQGAGLQPVYFGSVIDAASALLQQYIVVVRHRPHVDDLGQVGSAGNRAHAC